MKILYMGTADIAAAALKKLCTVSGVHVVGVVSQPDRPAGRNRVLTPSPVSQSATALGLPLLTPERVGDGESLLWMNDLAPDIIVVFAYGQFLPKKIRELAPYGAINIHPSDLPKLRGAAPLPWTIANGCDRTAVCIIRMEKEMDAGDILARSPLDITPEDTTETLGMRAAEMGVPLVVQTIEGLRQGTLRPMPQDPAQATHARKLEKADGQLDWAQDARALHNRVRAFSVRPGVRFHDVVKHPGEPIRVWKTCVEEGNGLPGTMMELGRDGPLIACGRNALRLLEIQLPGKRRMSAADAARGAGWTVGTRFE